jgi:AraC-like DNA-binding protein
VRRDARAGSDIELVAMGGAFSLDKVSDRTPTAGSTLTMTPFAPSEALAPYVRTFCIVETTRETTRSLLPDTGMTIAFRYSGTASLLDAKDAEVLSNNAISGLRTRARRMCTSDAGGVVVAILNAGCAGRFFGSRSPYDLFGRTAALEEWSYPEVVARTSAAIIAAHSPTTRIAHFERFLTEISDPDWRTDSLAMRAIAAIEQSAGTIRIAALARALGSSQDALEKRFRRVVGASPKRYASIVRFRRAIDVANQGRSLTEVSLAAGYADQSHFIREFRHVTGEAPRRFITIGEYCSSSRR